MSDDSAESGEAPDGGDASAGGDPRGEPAPLSELAERVGERREASQGDAFEDVFAEESFEELETDTVWDAAEDERESAFGAVGEVVEEGEATYVVSKRNFCERCRHFSRPPEVGCTNDGTEIREFVDKDNVRVFDCPIVEERGFVDTGPLG